MAFTTEQVRWLAHLARLELTPEQETLFASQLSAIVDYVNLLQQVDTSGVEPLSHSLPMANVFRDDEPRPCLAPDEALANAPDRQGDYYGVPAVLD